MQKLGQHFLINKTKLQKIAEVLDLKSGDAVIEIGPGHGELTKTIIKRLSDLVIENYRVIAIEKDRELARNLRSQIHDLKLDKKIEITEGDVLKILPQLITQLPNYPIVNYKIVGNIPYYITGYLLRILSELEIKPLFIALTIQKEVAERVCAQPPKMNLLAASVQFWAEPKIIDYIPKTDFQPQPKIDSAIIKLLPRIRADKTRINAEKYYEFIKIIFKQPRKTILNNLREVSQPKEEIIKILETLKINPGDRPQNLAIEKIKELAEKLK